MHEKTGEEHVDSSVAGKTNTDEELWSVGVEGTEDTLISASHWNGKVADLTIVFGLKVETDCPT